jgi:hypothetical protein
MELERIGTDLNSCQFLANPYKFQNGGLLGCPILLLREKYGNTLCCHFLISRPGNKARSHLWEFTKFLVHDTPDFDKTFEDRMKTISTLKFTERVKLVSRQKCKGREHLDEFVSKILARGGDGIVLRQAKSMYEIGNSKSLCKYTSHQEKLIFIEKSPDLKHLICRQYVTKF